MSLLRYARYRWAVESKPYHGPPVYPIDEQKPGEEMKDEAAPLPRVRWWDYKLTRRLAAVETTGPRTIVLRWSDAGQASIETHLPEQRDELCKELDRLIEAGK